MQRKPANRLGLRGAMEVKEHAWLKYYPWKELYDKTLESPFIPKVGDNFDARYCNQVDRLGNDTKDKYESYLRNDTLKEAFKCFTYFYLEGKEEQNFNNPHNNISNISDVYSVNMNKSLNLANSSVISGIGTSSSSPIEVKMRVDPSTNMENKFLRIKKQSNSSSTSSLLRQYRQSNVSNNSTNSSINVVKKSGSNIINNN